MRSIFVGGEEESGMRRVVGPERGERDCRERREEMTEEEAESRSVRYEVEEVWTCRAHTRQSSCEGKGREKTHNLSSHIRRLDLPLCNRAPYPLRCLAALHRSFCICV